MLRCTPPKQCPQNTVSPRGLPIANLSPTLTSSLLPISIAGRGKSRGSSHKYEGSDDRHRQSDLVCSDDEKVPRLDAETRPGACRDPMDESDANLDRREIAGREHLPAHPDAPFEEAIEERLGAGGTFRPCGQPERNDRGRERPERAKY